MKNQTQCLQPQCLKLNQFTDKFCHECGSKLLLAERYRALKILGQGSFGRTFQAIDEYKPSQPYCVIKQFLPEAQGTKNLQKAAQLFEQEAVRLDTLGKHDQIPELFAYFIQDQQQYLVQQFIDGQNLSDELADRSEPFLEAEITALLFDLLPVLNFIHSHQVIHRDIKPENIIRRKLDRHLILVDFGAAKHATQSSLATRGTIIGSPGYMAPEQRLGNTTFASDIYSLGVTCIHLLTQMDPSDLFDQDRFDWVWRKYLKQPISHKLGQILDRMIQGDLRRWQSANEVLQALQINPNYLPVPSPIVTINTPLSPTWEFTTFKVDQKGKTIEQKQLAAEVLTETLPGMILEMVKIPSGSFLMGYPDSQNRRYLSETPQHQVSLPSFYLGKFTVTQIQWHAVAQLPKITLDLDPNPAHFQGDNLPVERVSWYQAVEFCARLGKITGKKYRLPSESEWEYACSAGANTPFSFGATLTTNIANYDGDYTYSLGAYGVNRKTTTEVGSFPPNDFGLYDLHGNLWEWCADIWHDNYNGSPTDGQIWLGRHQNYFSAIEKYTNGSYHKYLRVLRGGSWNYHPWYCRTTYRQAEEPGQRSNIIGFRLCLSV